MTAYRKVFYRIGQASSIVLLIGWFWWCGLQDIYLRWPRFPQPEIGRTIPHELKGIIVYISREDAEVGRNLIWTMIVAGSLTIICLVFSGELNRILNPPKPPLPPEC